MKETMTDANFPRTADGRVYHLGIRPGEIANRIITVGPPSRARSIARLLSAHPPPWVLESERGFLTITGRYGADADGAGTPVSVVAVGMGAANMDFFVREARECVSGDMVVVRLGSCGGLLDALPVGSIVVPRASVAVMRNYDFDFGAVRGEGEPYRVSKPACADSQLHEAILDALTSCTPPRFEMHVRGDTVNASTDSFYSSQGRQTSFPDHNAGLIEHLLHTVPDLASLEMETFHLFHLAASWPGGASAQPAAPPSPADRTPPRASATIRAASAQMIFAARTSREFITPEHVRDVELWTGRAVLGALAGFVVAPEMLEKDEGSVWEVK